MNFSCFVGDLSHSYMAVALLALIPHLLGKVVAKCISHVVGGGNLRTGLD